MTPYFTQGWTVLLIDREFDVQLTPDTLLMAFCFVSVRADVNMDRCRLITILLLKSQSIPLRATMSTHIPTLEITTKAAKLRLYINDTQCIPFDLENRIRIRGSLRYISSVEPLLFAST